MTIALSSIAIEEKNKLATDSVFLVCLKITIPGLEDPLYIVRDSQNLAWNGITWVAFPFEIDEIGDTNKGEVPQVNIRVSNVSRAMEFYIQQYDADCKNNGFAPITVNIYVVNTAAIAADPDAPPEVEHLFELSKPQSNAQWVTFVLGAANPFTRRFPRNRFLKSHCRVQKFKDADCGYSGAETICDRTLTRCRELGNSDRFGGFPGIGLGGLRLA